MAHGMNKRREQGCAQIYTNLVHAADCIGTMALYMWKREYTVEIFIESLDFKCRTIFADDQSPVKQSWGECGAMVLNVSYYVA